MDKEYWENFYKDAYPGLLEPSSFAVFCSNIIEPHSKIVDLGCGNARDTQYFSNSGHLATGIDQAIHNTEQVESDNLKLLKADFTRYDYRELQAVDIFYSRFSIHSINQQEEKELMLRVYEKLERGGSFCVEARTVNDRKYGKGKKVCKNTYELNGHSRRFINSNKFVQSCIDIGFKLKYFYESQGLSIYNDDDPVLMRLIVTK